MTLTATVARWVIASGLAATLMIVVALVLVAAFRHGSASVTASLLTAAFAGALVVPLLIAVGVGSVFTVPESLSFVGLAELDGRPGAMHRSWLVATTWVAGVVASCTRIAGRRIRLRRLIRGAAVARDRHLIDMLARLAAATQTRVPSLRITSSDAGAFSSGILRPVIVLPTAARGWSLSQTSLVLRHELAHVRRRDTLTLVLSAAALTVHWYNPLVWIANRVLRDAIERATDDAVLAGGASPEEYADLLVRLARCSRPSIARVASMGTCRLAVASCRTARSTPRNAAADR